jgi:hypothetical protein
VSEVTITDARHSLFRQRLALTDERSGRGPAFVVVRLSDGRKRAIRLAATDLCAPAPARTISLPRVSVRTLIPLAQHLDRILNLLIEEVIRDEPTSPSASARCVSTTDPGHRGSPASGGIFPSMAEFAATNASSAGPNTGRTVAADAAGDRTAGKGDIPC